MEINIKYVEMIIILLKIYWNYVKIYIEILARIDKLLVLIVRSSKEVQVVKIYKYIVLIQKNRWSKFTKYISQNLCW